MKPISAKPAILVLCLLVSFLPACGSSRTQQAPAATVPLNGDTLIKTELVFGLSMPNGEAVSQNQWQTFVDEVVTPRFPAGLTILDGYGQFTIKSNELIKEPSKVIMLLHKHDENTDIAIEEIREIYKKRFQQKSVLRISVPVSVSF